MEIGFDVCGDLVNRLPAEISLTGLYNNGVQDKEFSELGITDYINFSRVSDDVQQFLMFCHTFEAGNTYNMTTTAYNVYAQPPVWKYAC